MSSSRLSLPRILLGAVLLFLLHPTPAKADEPVLTGGERGRLHLISGETIIADFVPFAANSHWQRFYPKVSQPKDQLPLHFKMEVDGKKLDGQFEGITQANGVDGKWTFTAAEDLDFQALAITADFPLHTLAGGSWETDSAKGAFPESFGGAGIFNGEAKTLSMTFPNGKTIRFSFPTPVYITLQDNRQWGTPDFTLRLGRPKGKMTAVEKFVIQMNILFGDKLAYQQELPEFLKPVTLEAGDEWIPLQTELEILPGSALDLSAAGFTEGPCGTKGRIIATPNGHFAYANEPSVPKRFYGVNFCFSAQFLSKDKVDRLLDRLVRLGYNTIRIHHYETNFSTPSGKTGFDWDPAKIDQLDYLMAEAGRRGLWVTTDLYVSRPVSGKQIGLEEKEIPMNTFKILIPVHEPAFEDWAKFARMFLDRVNPYTKKRVADDPALAWISLVNEGPLTHGWWEMRTMPQWISAWNKWLAERYPDRDKLGAALGDLSADEEPAKNSIALPGGLASESPRSQLARLFVAEMEKKTYERMRDFLRKELKCEALLTNMNNAGPSVTQLQLARSEYDYVDEHFYVDHPTFLEKPWRLPSMCPNNNPIAAGAPGSSSVASVRLWDKPFTVSEYNYSGPGRFRGVGGLLTGAMAAIQDWDAVWRFAYSHSDKALFEPAPITYFDLVTDPLNQAADRLTLFLYMRKDLKPSPTRLAVIIPPEFLTSPSGDLKTSALQSVAWMTGIGSLVISEPPSAEAGFVTVPLQEAGNKEAILQALAGQKSLPKDGNIRSETGELQIFPGKGLLVIDTERSAGGYADTGGTIACPIGGITINALTADATVFANSLEDAPIRKSKRIVITHLTDLQNTGMHYGEAARQTLLDWGKTPHLVRAGEATLELSLDKPADYSVWALATNGQRLEKLPTKVESDRLVFTVSVKGKDGARMLYEVARD